MEVAAYGVGILGEWVVLMVVLPIAQRLADFALPGLIEMAWKLLVIIIASTLTSLGLGHVNGLLGTIGGLVVFWIGMVRVFDVDFFGAVIIVVIRFFVNWLIAVALIAVFLSM